MNVPIDPILPPVPLPHGESIIVPAVSGSEEKKKRQSFSFGPIILGTLAVLILFGGIGMYLFVIMPRQNTIRVVDEIKPHLITLKSATSDVIENMNSIHALATEQNTTPSKPNMQTTGVMVRPNISALTNTSNVLGSAIAMGQRSLVEEGFRSMAMSLRGTLRTILQHRGDVAGIETVSNEENSSTFRKLKTETVKTNESVRKAEAALEQLIQASSSPKGVLPRDAKGKITSSETLKISAKGYFSEAAKIAEYYEVLSDIVIEMDTKITSFKNAIASAGSGFGSVMRSGNSETAKTTLLQVQVFLDQADRDMKSMKALSEKLNAVSSDVLPMAIHEYHEHNKKVLQVATTYFTVQSGILQGLVTGATNIVNKSEANALTMTDLTQYQNQLTIGVSQSALSDATFASDLQTLQGEEGSLVTTFWQNNSRIGDGEKVAEAVKAYQATMEKLRNDNKLQGILQ